MGNTVAKALVTNDADVKTIRGQWLEVMGLPCVVTYHPLAARRRPVLLDAIIKDLAVIARRLHD
jgi:DNA polymerase